MLCQFSNPDWFLKASVTPRNAPACTCDMKQFSRIPLMIISPLDLTQKGEPGKNSERNFL